MGGVVWFYDAGQESGQACGYAGRLVFCSLVRVSPDASLSLGMGYGPGQAWIEDPEYHHENEKIPVNSLGALWRKVGRFHERALLAGHKVSLVRPSYWKGSIAKGPHHAQVRRTLTPQELTAVNAGLVGVPVGAQHNVWDAVCGCVWAMRKIGDRV